MPNLGTMGLKGHELTLKRTISSRLDYLIQGVNKLSGLGLKHKDSIYD